MSYVSLENSEPFLKCFEVIAEDKSCIVSDSVLYFSGKTGKGFVTATGIAAGIEVLAVNDLEDANHASGAVADGRLFIVGMKKVYCIGVK